MTIADAEAIAKRKGLQAVVIIEVGREPDVPDRLPERSPVPPERGDAQGGRPRPPPPPPFRGRSANAESPRPNMENPR